MSIFAASALPCYLAAIDHAHAGCTNEGVVYKGHKWFERDMEDGGEFICPTCDLQEAKDSYAAYAAFCLELDGGTPELTLEEWIEAHTG